MNRRELITGFGGAAVAWPLAARAQQSDGIARIGVLSADLSTPISREGYPAMIAELRKLGFTEGRNLVIGHRRIDEGITKAFIGANELVAGKVDLLVVSGAEVGLQAAAARPAAPIVVMANNFDPMRVVTLQVCLVLAATSQVYFIGRPSWLRSNWNC